jgi:hypothetical protein
MVMTVSRGCALCWLITLRVMIPASIASMVEAEAISAKGADRREGR